MTLTVQDIFWPRKEDTYSGVIEAEEDILHIYREGTNPGKISLENDVVVLSTEDLITIIDYALGNLQGFRRELAEYLLS